MEAILHQEVATLKTKLEGKEELIRTQNDDMSSLKKQLEELTLENSRLKQVMAKDVENSSIPSSVNVYKKKIANNREPSSKPKGGQKGHQGHSLVYLTPTKVIPVDHEEVCPQCGIRLNTIKEKKKQLVDAYIELKVEEYQIKMGRCPNCGYMSKPNTSNQLVNSVTYGKSLKAMVVLLNTYGLVSINRTSRMIKELTGGQIKIAESSICNIIKEASNQCAPAIEVIKEKLISSPVLHVDETPIRTEGRLSYVQLQETKRILYFRQHKRGGNPPFKKLVS